MTRTLLTTALVLTLAGPALASDQLARSLGVEPGVYTTAQLIELRDAKADSDWVRYNAIKREAAEGDFTASTSGIASPGAQQIADAIGVNSNEYTLAQLVELRDAEADNNWTRVNAIKSEAAEGGFDVSSKSAPSAGHVQLAESLGVEPTAYSLNELVAMKSARDSD